MTFYDQLRTLLDWRADPGTRVLSLYLDLTRSPGDLAEDLSEGLHEADFPEVFIHDPDGLKSVVQLLEQRLPGEIESARALGYDGLALFHCREPALAMVFRLRFALDPGLTFSHEPQTWQLAYYEEEYEPAVAIVLDGPATQLVELHVGDVASHHRVRPSHGRSLEQEVRVELHRLLHDRSRAHLLVLGPDADRARLLASLEPALRERVIGEHDRSLAPGAAGFLPVVHRLLQAYERRSEVAGVRSLLVVPGGALDPDAVASDVAAVVEAINQGRIRKFYMLQSFAHRGWLCDACDRLGTLPVPPSCTACGASVARVPLERHLVQQARACGAEIETVHESEELAGVGGVAAALLPR
ncbi:MAG: hypothetical protein EOO75_03020 [Myxococcales bacterium]|nr:MAG: hypothetical protein EOO75_03020 [Myxococcales bacterium]